MALWELKPAARPDDPRWQGRRQFARVVVRAATPAFARLVAAPMDTPDVAREAGHQDPTLGSGFRDEKLYFVVPYRETAHRPDGPDEVLETEGRAV